MIVGLSGYAGAGKDSLAQFLVDGHGFVRVAFADAIRDALYALNPLVGTSARHLPLSDVVDAFGWDRAKAYPQVRELLQRMGTEAGREVHGPDCWVHVAMREAAQHERVVFTDMRMVNELHAIKDAGGMTVRVTRPGVGPANQHVTETALANVKHDFTVHNDRTVSRLAGTAERLVMAMHGRKAPA